MSDISRRVRWGLLSLVLAVVIPASADSMVASAADGTPVPLVLRYLSMPSGDTRDIYNLTLLNAALAVTESDFGPWVLQNVASTTLQQRAFRLMDDGAIDIYWGTTSAEREQAALPVRFPLMAGLLGYRVLLIRSADEARFARIRNLDQLASLRAIQGHDWPDTDILRSNGLTVSVDANYYAMFRSLSDRLVDYFPRGVLEAYAEQHERATPDLMVEPHLLLVYPSASYFFVAKGNQALARRLDIGLHRLLDSGRFDDILFGLPLCQEALSQAKLEQRLRLELQNPAMPALPLEQAELWFSPERYQRWLSRQPSH